ncbi:MAG: DUF502 domain-containing protein [Cytophagales bacterium]|nr:DUF502 domain-containing protein [Cytophagales bacterium]
MRKNLINYFFRGLLLAVPFVLTIYVIAVTLRWIDGLIQINIPGLGILIIFIAITALGYLGSSFIIKPIFNLIEHFVVRLPLINIIYSSLKELIAAFVGDKRKFGKPVLVLMNRQENIQRLGFLTQEDLQGLNLPGSVTVYLPHSYNFSGNLFIVPKDRIKPLNISSTEVMKFIVSGGVAGLK